MFRHPATGTYTFGTRTGAHADAFLYTDPIATDQTLPQVAGTGGRLCWHDSGTASPGVGPTSGPNGSPSGYIYTEASVPGNNNQSYYIEFDTTLNSQAHHITIDFETNQRGTDNNASCVVQTNENGAGWVDRGTEFSGASDDGYKIATDGTDVWASRSVDLTGLISHASTRVRLHVYFNGSANVWQSDYGVGNIVITGVDRLAYDQEGFQFREDDGSESAASDIGAQDANATRAIGSPIRLRILTDTNNEDPPSAAVALQYRKVGDDDSEWRDVPL